MSKRYLSAVEINRIAHEHIYKAPKDMSWGTFLRIKGIRAMLNRRGTLSYVREKVWGAARN